MNFSSVVYVNDQLNRMMVSSAKEFAERCIKSCAVNYNFDGDEAVRLLGLENVKLSHREPSEKKKAKVVVAKTAFPMPYNGELNDECCYALRQNNGLYTQCQSSRKDGKNFCKQCQILADRGVEGIPEYGTIQMRQAVDIFEYTDPKGRKPVAFTKVMKKYKITQEQALEEAGKFNINIDEKHFAFTERDSKRGRPSSLKEKTPKEPKGAKGRPKKEKKVLQVEGADDDLFASLVADANSNSAEEIVSENIKKVKTDEERETERLAKEAEKQEKELKRLAEKAEKETKLAAEKAEKELKRLAEKAEKEAKLAAEKAEKEAKLAEEKAEKEALAKQKKELKKKAEEDEKLAKKELTKVKKTAAAPKEDDEDEPEVVKKIEIDGKKYLKSKKSGIIYDYQEYVKNSEQVVIGKWNDSTNKIDFKKPSEEEEEEEYDV